jgi:lipopolysaccharide transport system permease protein
VQAAIYLAGVAAGHGQDGRKNQTRRQMPGQFRKARAKSATGGSLFKPPMQTLIIEPGRAERNYWRDLVHYRELFFILAWRDVAVRYKQTVAGVAWALIQPLMSMVIMTFIFEKLAGLHSEGNAPYPVMVFAAILPWQFFSNALSLASQSVVTNANLISKIYFPRLIVPASSVMVSLVDFLVACSILAGLMIWYHFWPTWRLIILPALVLLAIAAAVGPGLITTALTVKYRDFRILIPFVVQFGMYLCPIAYSSSLMREKLGEKWFLLYSVNPMVGVIDGFRWAILGTSASFDWHGFIISVVLTGVLLYIGIRYFRKIERVFADII